MLNPELDVAPLRTAYSTVRQESLRLTVGSDGSNRLVSYSSTAIDLEHEGRAIAEVLREYLPDVGAPAGEIEIDEAMQEQLRALGYLP